MAMIIESSCKCASKITDSESPCAHATVYVGTREGLGNFKGTVASLDAKTGRIIWSTPVPQPAGATTSGSFAVGVAGSYVIAGGPTTAFAFARSTGALVKTFTTEEFLGSTAAYSEQLWVIASTPTSILLGTNEGTIAAFDGTDLHRLWVTNTQQGSVQGLLSDGTQIFSTYPNQAAVLRLTDGLLQLKIKPGSLRTDRDEQINSAPGVEPGRMFFGGLHELYALRRP